MVGRTILLLGISVILGVYSESVGSYYTIPTAVNSVGVGYNLLYGNPGGVDMRHGGEDPGMLMTRHILRLESEGGAPVQTVYEHHDSCQTTSSESLVFSPKSYQDHLKEGFTFAGTPLPSLQASAFSLSSGYTTVKKETSDLHYVLQDNSATCVLGTARYTLSKADGNYYHLTDEFVTDVCSLPEIFDSAKYTAFLDTWGTHIITGMKIGSRQTTTTVGKRRDYIEAVLKKAKDDVSIGGPMYGWDSSWVVDYDTLKLRPDVTISVGSSVFRFSIGDTNSPEPVGLNLISIDVALTPDFWHEEQYPLGACQNMTRLSTSSRRQNVIKALQQYSAVKNADSPQVEMLAMPVVWPGGFSGLPKPQTGCPNPSSEWMEGWLTQTTETQSPDNNWNATHMDATLTSDKFTLKFCMKTIPTDEFSMEWPAGDYCIFKFKSCPTGFVEGYIQWDDDDTENGNAHGGVVPEGNYGRDIRMNYCCRSDADTFNAISLPTGKPFYLFQYKHGCQEVKGMTHSTEQLFWDDEDSKHPTDASIGSVHPGMVFCNPPRYPGCGSGSRIFYCHYQKSTFGVSIIG